MAQAFAKAFYKSKKWRKCRAAFVASRVKIDGGLCQICRDAPGYIVHHKVWLTPENITDPDIALNPANFLYVCHDCHNKIENDGGNLYYFDENGQPQPADKANASGATPPYAVPSPVCHRTEGVSHKEHTGYFHMTGGVLTDETDLFLFCRNPGGGERTLPDDVIEAVRAILEHGNTAEIKRRKNGEIIVLEVRRKVKKSAVQ